MPAGGVSAQGADAHHGQQGGTTSSPGRDCYRPHHGGAYIANTGSGPGVLEVKHQRPVLFATGLAVALGCGDPIAPFNGIYDFRVEVETGDTVRSAVVHVPPSYDGGRAYPLVLAFHGWGGSGAGLQYESGLDAVADSLGFIVAYPDGIVGWDVQPDRDVQFLHDLIAHLERRLGIARDRVYATGFSSGAWFTMRLACEESAWLAGAGVVAATMYEERAPLCQPSPRITTALVVGTDDYLVPIDGAFGRLSADATIAVYAERNGCDLPERTVTYEPDRLDDGRRVRRESYRGCENDTETVLWVVEGGDHSWYRGDVDVGMLLGRLFLRHKR
jgi:polyhydroxybutyrate depolymerase